MSTILPRLLEVAAERGDASAIVSPGMTLTYAALYGHAAALAERLRAEGCGSGSIVALELPHGAEHVVALLGVWLAGAAFAPIDARYPAQRRRLVVELLRPARILGRADIASLATATAAFPSVAADELAYVICSSGTTGAPKAVAVTHRGLPAVIGAQVDCFAIGAASKVLWTLSPAFDASLSDILTTLLAGATLHIASAAQLVPGVTLEETLCARGITHWDLPPALLRRMDAARLPACVQTLVIGGEVTPPEVVRAFARRCRVVNVYGPTEATICTSMVRCDADTWTRPLIGTPVPGVRYRLDGDELLIGGPAVARGYVGDPELTAARFISEDHERWYRTRDRVRAHAGGVLEFVGRIDRQLKVRGVLVEPEELEACLARFPGVLRAAVALHAEQLVAYVAPPLEEAALRVHLARALPPTHLPARIVMLAELPTTAAGKVDYAALLDTPLPGAGSNQGEGGVLASLWAEVLHLPAVGLDDDLRGLGASSLDVLSVTAKAHAAGLLLAPEMLASAGTVRGMLDNTAPRALTAEWLRNDVRELLHALPPRGAGASSRGERAFFTGATGFVGARLLDELLKAGREVVCLVRDEQRIAPRRGVRVMRGDLEQARLGLGAAQWDELERTVGDIVHCAARVSLVAPYDGLRNANVAGTLRVLELCRRGSAKRVTHVSTLSIFADADHAPKTVRFDEQFPLERTVRVHGGYAQSKWAAEQLVHQMAREVSDLACVRLGLVIGDPLMPRHDLFATVVRGMGTLASLPMGLSPALQIDALPVDYVARALAALIQAPAATYHLVSDAGMTLAMLRSAFAELGHSFVDVDPDVWLAAQQVRRTPSIAVAALAHALDPVRFVAYRALDPFAASHLTFEATQTQRVLAETGVGGCAPPTPALTANVVRHILSDA